MLPRLRRKRPFDNRANHSRRAARRMPQLESLEVRRLLSALYSYTPVDVPGAISSQAFGINASGQVVGVYVGIDEQRDLNQGFLLSGSNYTTLDAPDSFDTEPTGINESGQIVGTYLDASGSVQGFLLSGGNYTTFELPGGLPAYPAAINDSGQIVGQYETHGFLLSGSNYTTLDPPDSIDTQPAGINDSGQIVGNYEDFNGDYNAFLLSGGNYATLDVPGAIATEAFGINNSGQIVGSYTDASHNEHGFLLSGGSYTTLDFPGASETISANGINNSGQVVGAYSVIIDNSSQLQSFLANSLTPPAIPTYNSNGSLGSITQTSHNANGSSTSATWNYNSDGSLGSISELVLNSDGSTAANITFTYQAGALTAITDQSYGPAGSQTNTEWDYNSNGSVAEITESQTNADGSGTDSSSNYAANGSLMNETTNSYGKGHALNQTTKITPHPDGSTTTVVTDLSPQVYGPSYIMSTYSSTKAANGSITNIALTFFNPDGTISSSFTGIWGPDDAVVTSSPDPEQTTSTEVRYDPETGEWVDLDGNVVGTDDDDEPIENGSIFTNGPTPSPTPSDTPQGDSNETTYPGTNAPGSSNAYGAGTLTSDPQNPSGDNDGNSSSDDTDDSSSDDPAVDPVSDPPAIVLAALAKATPTLAVTDSGGTFNGNPFPGTATIAGSNGQPGASLEGVSPTLSYFVGPSPIGTPLSGPPVNAGTYTVLAFFPGSQDYTSASDSATFVISQARPTVSIADVPIFTGRPFFALATVSGVVKAVDDFPAVSLEGIIPSLTYYAGSSASGTPLPGAPVDVGTYTVVASYPGSVDYTSATASSTLSISPAPSVPAAPLAPAPPTVSSLPSLNGTTATSTVVSSDLPDGSTYGQAVTFETTVSASNGGKPTGSVQFEIDGANFGAPVNLENGTAQVTTAGLPAGKHQVTALFVSSSTTFSNSNDTSNPLSQTVSPAKLTVTAEDQTVPFGSPSPILTVTYTGFVNGDTPSVLSGTPALSTTATQSSNVGTYPITVSQGSLSDANYQFTFVAGTLTINPAPMTVVAESELALANAVPPALTAGYNGILTGQLTVPPNLSTSAVLSSPAGEYPIVPAGAVDPNYQFSYMNGYLTVLTVTTRHLQRVIATQPGVPITLAGDPTQIANDLVAISGLPPQSTPVTINLVVATPIRLTTLPPTGVTVNVILGTATSTVVTPSTATVSYGNSATFTATVSSAMGTPPDGSVQFFVNDAAYSSPQLLNGATAQIVISDPAGQYIVSAEYDGDAKYAATLTGQETPASFTVTPNNITSELSPRFGGFVYNRTKRQFTQTLTITNVSGAAINGPIDLVLNNLENARLVNQSGTTQGSPYITVLDNGSLGAGQSLTITLVFKDPTLAAITDTPEFLMGPIPSDN